MKERHTNILLDALTDRMLDRGDSEGSHVWARIKLAIEALQAPRRGEPN